MEISCWNLSNYPGESVFTSLASQASFWGTVQGRAPSINRIIAKKSTAYFQNLQVELKSLKENIDTSTPTGKLMFHIIGALAEFERDIISERAQAGLEAARARGRQGGRPKAKIRPDQLERARKLHAARQNTVAEIMALTGFKSRATYYKYVVDSAKPQDPQV